MTKVLKLIINLFFWNLIEAEELQQHPEPEQDVGPEDDI